MSKKLTCELGKYVPFAWFISWPEYVSDYLYTDLLLREIDIFFDASKMGEPILNSDLELCQERAIYFSVKSEQALELNWIANFIDKLTFTNIFSSLPLPQVTLELSQNVFNRAQRSIGSIINRVDKICVIADSIIINNLAQFIDDIRFIKSFDKIVIFDFDFSRVPLNLWREYSQKIIRMSIDGFSISFKQPQQSAEFILEFFIWLDAQTALCGYESDGFFSYVKSNTKERANSAYMNIYRARLPLKGLGLGAESFFGFTRAVNVGNVDDYQTSLELGALPYKKIECLTYDQINYEQIILSLCAKSGISLEVLMSGFSPRQRDTVKKRSSMLVREGFLSSRNEAGEGSEAIKLTRAGILQDDQVIAWLLREY